ncbi:cation:dicarboxylase symporter family transporter, partial [Anoxybacillus sp. LAT_38]|nr:cation:dicarboxylase symporter family transporter [Anoxybacillus sp. LAT_38]
IVTTIAIIVGLLAANLFQPGVGVDMSQLTKTDIHKYVETAETSQSHGFIETFVNIVPKNVFEAIVKGDMLAIIFFS